MIDIKVYLPLILRMEKAAELIRAYVDGAGFKDCHHGTGFASHLLPWDFMRNIVSMSQDLLELAREMQTLLLKHSAKQPSLDPRSELILSNAYDSCCQLESNLTQAPHEVRNASGLTADKVPPDHWAYYCHGFPGDKYGDDHSAKAGFSQEYEIWLGQLQKAALDHLKRAADLVSDIKKWVNLSLDSAIIIPPPQLKWADLSEREQKVLTQLATDPSSSKTSGQLADDLKLKATLVLGVLRSDRRLCKNGLVEPVRGRGGGFKITEAGLRLYKQGQRLT